MNTVEEFNRYRSQMNEKILDTENLVLKRIFNLDTQAFSEGALDVKTKEMLGLACSMVLRCDDCVKYHLGRCKEENVTGQQVFEIFSIANLIGGTIVIPQLRKAAEYWEELNKQK